MVFNNTFAKKNSPHSIVYLTTSFLSTDLLNMTYFASLNTYLIALIILSVLLTVITCTSILIEKNGNPKLQWLLLIIFVGISFYNLRNLFVITGLIRDFPFLLRGFVPFYYIIQPAIYFYVVFNLDENYIFSKRDLLHLVPLVYSIIDNYGFYSGGPNHWQYWANSISSLYGNIANYPGTLMKVKYNFLLRVLLYISYTMFSWRYYVKNIQFNAEIKNQFVLKWLKLFLIFISIYVVSIAFTSVYSSSYISSINEQSNYFLRFPLFANSLTTILLSSYILFNPILLYGLPKINFKTISDNDKSLSKFKTLNIENENNENNKINTEIIDIHEYNLALSIVSEIKEKQLYKDIDFSLALASKYFFIPSHHISFVINKYIKKSFPDIVCEMRIEHAIQLLKDKSHKKYTMEAIGNLSGFNYRTTFYAGFKKITGITPSEYLQNLTHS